MNCEHGDCFGLDRPVVAYTHVEIAVSLGDLKRHPDWVGNLPFYHLALCREHYKGNSGCDCSPERLRELDLEPLK
jgi:hypothetical protein